MNEFKNDDSIKPPEFNYNDFLKDLREREKVLALAEERYLDLLRQMKTADRIRDKYSHNINNILS